MTEIKKEIIKSDVFDISVPGKYLLYNNIMILLDESCESSEQKQESISIENKLITANKSITKDKLITKEQIIEKYGEDAITFEYRNGDWRWKDMEGLYHLIRDGIELTKGLKAKWVDSYSNEDWKWEDMEGECHKVENNEQPIIDGLL